jgi:hypothetical protein
MLFENHILFPSVRPSPAAPELPDQWNSVRRTCIKICQAILIWVQFEILSYRSKQTFMNFSSSVTDFDENIQHFLQALQNPGQWES